MIAVTVASGKNYIRMASAAAESVYRNTGLKTFIVSDSDPDYPAHYEKLRLFSRFNEPIFYFDADTRMIRPWYLNSIKFFSASLDFNSKAKRIDCLRYKIDPVRYINTGVMVMFPENKGVLEEALAIATAPDYKTPFFEQTALNVAIQRSGMGVCYLPRKYNAMCGPRRKVPDDAVILHGAGGRMSRRRMEYLVSKDNLRRLTPPKDSSKVAQ